MWMGTEGNETGTDHLELVLHTIYVKRTIDFKHRWAVLRRNDKIGKPGCLLFPHPNVHILSSRYSSGISHKITADLTYP